MSFFWVIVVFGWVIPFVLRRMNQDARRRQMPPGNRGYNRYGGYPGNPYPRGYPGTQPPPRPGEPVGPPPEQPAGQVPSPQADGAWWRQPIPPGSFPGQTIPEPDQTIREPGQVAEPQPAPPPPLPETAEPQGYRARKLAELDKQFTDQKISLEEYMKARNEVMRG